MLTALVWFRVLNRSDGAGQATPKTCPSTSATVSPNLLPRPQSVSLVVLNATTRNGLAASTSKALRKNGFKVAQFGNDGPAYGGHGLIRGVAEIRYGPSAQRAATLLHYYLPSATMTLTHSSSPIVTVALGARYKTLAAATAVRAKLKANHIKLGVIVPAVTTPRPSPTC